MSKNKPTIPSGTRDFGPEKMMRRNFIFGEIKKIFTNYGFLPLETPAMENLDVLTGKYGDEGDKLIFKVLNSGNFLEKIDQAILSSGYKDVTSKISKKALRYDLTVPFARYVAMNRNDIHFPFKRFQIQPVWRADTPQKGRYREFYQCDADVVGTNSLLCETEIILLINDVFKALNILNFTIKINNRKILEGIAHLFQLENNLTDLTVAIDKLDKIGAEGVIAELIKKGIEPIVSNNVVSYFTNYQNQEDNLSKLNYFENEFIKNNIEIGSKGIKEIKEVLSYIEAAKISKSNIEFDVTLARGLSYYTGAIIEVKANDVQMGSISGGGRYDNLTGVFGLAGVSGVGISFGVDRIYDVMEELNLFPENKLTDTKVLFCYFDIKGSNFILPFVQQLRSLGIPSELYLESGKIKKQMEYANKRNIPFVVVIGEEELKSHLFTFKNMLNGEQTRVSLEDILIKLTT